MMLHSLRRLLVMALILAMTVSYAPVRADDDMIVMQTEETEAGTTAGEENVPALVEAPSKGGTEEDEDEKPPENTGEETEESTAESGEGFVENVYEIPAKEEKNAPADPAEGSPEEAGIETITDPKEDPSAQGEHTELVSSEDDSETLSKETKSDAAGEIPEAIQENTESNATGEKAGENVEETPAASFANEKSDATAISMPEAEETSTTAPVEESASVPASNAVPENEEEALPDADDEPETTANEEMTPEAMDTAAIEEPAEPVMAESIVEECGNLKESPSGTIEEYIRRALYGTPKGMRGTVAYYALRENERRLYDALKPYISKLAAGELSRSVIQFPVSLVYDKNPLTAEELGVERLIYWDETEQKWRPDGKALEAYRKRYPLVFIDVFAALLFDFPYEFYWQDKVLNTSYIGSVIATNGKTMWTSLEKDDGSPLMITVSFPVSKDYSVSGEKGTYDLDTSYGESVQAAITNARKIVSDNAGKTNLEKLSAYADKICELTDYNYDAAGSGSASYGNPWQLIWVFDGNPETKVVCEGFSKAFQYLCDLSSFSGNIEVISVSGRYAGSSEGHMWNLVTLDNGYRYLVDLTNIRIHRANLFMRGYTRKVSDREYVYEDGTKIYDYIFNEETYNLFHEGHLDPDPDWTISGDVLTITVIGNTGNYASADDVPWADRLDDIKEVVIGNHVKGLGDNVLSGLTLRSLTLPASLESISSTALVNTTVEQVVIEECSAYLIAWAEENDLDYSVLHHELTAHERVEPTVTKPGNEAYWSCDTCGKLFSDAEGENEIDAPIQLYLVKFDVNGGIPEIDDQIVKYQQMVEEPEKPEKQDSTFLGWFEEDAAEDADPFDFDTPITENITLVAWWQEADVPNLAGIRMNLEGKIQMIVRFKLPVKLKDAGYSVKLGDQATIPFSDKEYDPSTDSYYFKCYVLAPEYDQEIEISIVDAEGNAVPFLYKDESVAYNVFPYSLKTYIQNMKQKTDGAQLALIEALDVYCKAAKHRFLDGEAVIVSADMSSVEDTVKPETLPEGISKITRSLSFEEDNTLRFRIYLDEAGTEDNYTYTIPAGAEKTVNGNVVMIAVRNIAAPNLDVRYTVSVSDGNVTATTIASPLSYLKGVIGKYSDGTDELSYALYNYCKAAKDYFNK